MHKNEICFDYPLEVPINYIQKENLFEKFITCVNSHTSSCFEVASNCLSYLYWINVDTH